MRTLPKPERRRIIRTLPKPERRRVIRTLPKPADFLYADICSRDGDKRVKFCLYNGWSDNLHALSPTHRTSDPVKWALVNSLFSDRYGITAIIFHRRMPLSLPAITDACRYHCLSLQTHAAITSFHHRRMPLSLPVITDVHRHRWS